MKMWLLIPVAFVLAGCVTTKQPQVIVKREIEVITPDAALYNCPIVTKFPNPDTLTDVEVAKLIVQMHRNNRQCKNSMQSIQKFLDSAKAQTESLNGGVY